MFLSRQQGNMQKHRQNACKYGGNWNCAGEVWKETSGLTYTEIGDDCKSARRAPKLLHLHPHTQMCIANFKAQCVKQD